MKNKKTIVIFTWMLVVGVSLFFMLMSFDNWPDQAIAEVTSSQADISQKADGIPEESEWKAPDQEAAKIRANETVPFIEAVLDECLLCRQQKLREMELGIDDMSNTYFLLDSPIIKKTGRLLRACQVHARQACRECK